MRRAVAISSLVDAIAAHMMIVANGAENHADHRDIGVTNPTLVVPVLAFTAFGLLILTILTGFAYDSQQPFDVPLTHAMSS